MLVARYSPECGADLAKALKPLLVSADAARKAPKILMESGIRFVIVEALASTKIDGVCFWLDAQSPVIGMTLRYDRIDNFWFVLRHEIEHVLQGHGRTAAILDAGLEGDRAGIGDGVPPEERLANKAAADFCVVQSQLDRFIARKAPVFAERDILGFAKTIGVHPGLVAGQLQHRTRRYDLYRNHLVKVRSVVTPSAIVDGWGDVAPIGI
jgi:HTH-type transcriptional regulator/antitoxin HigA